MQGIILCTKRLLTVWLLLLSGISLANTSNQNSSLVGSGTLAVQTVIKSEYPLVKTQTVPKHNAIKLLPKTKRQQQQLLTRHVVDDDDTDDYDDLDIYVAYRRPRITDEDGEEALSPRILDRLKTARMLAMLTYHKHHR